MNSSRSRFNKYKKYKITKSLKGEDIVYIARAGKQKKVIGRASSEAELIKMMADAAKKYDEETAAIETDGTESSSDASKKDGKKLKLWKAGGLVDKVKEATKPATKKSSSKSSSSKKSSSKSQPKVSSEELE